VTTTKNIETPAVSDGTGLAEALLGLEGFRVLAVHETPAEVVVEIETAAAVVGCPSCGARAEAQDRMPVDIRDLPCFGRPARLVWRKRRWRCREERCGERTWTETSEHVSTRAVLTRRAGLEACRRVGENARPVSQLADELGVCWWTVMTAVDEHGRRSVTTPIQDLLSQDVGVSGVLSKFSQHLKLECPHGPCSTAVDHVVGLQRRHRSARAFATTSILGLHARDGVRVAQGEGPLGGCRDADGRMGAAGDGLVEPHAFDEGHVLDQAQQRRLRGHEAQSGLLLAQTVEAVVQRRPVPVDELVDPVPEIVGPVTRWIIDERHATTLTTPPRERSGAHAAIPVPLTAG
jgi:zinc-finger of transposase IS204/IS1001/IS1096/IS1165